MSARAMRRQNVRRRARERARRVALVSALTVGGGAVLASGADAATFNVTNLDDAGPGSLRQAILDANATAAADTVTFASTLSGTIELTTGEIPIDAALTVQGPGADVIRVSAGGNSNHFDIDTGVTGAAYDDVSLRGLKLTDGYDTSAGGSLYISASDVTLAGMVLKGNHSTDDSGAIEVEDGDVAITDSQIIGNTSEDGGGAMYFDGDGGTDSDLTITDSVFANNHASGNGGAIYFDNGGEHLVIEGSTFRDNFTSTDGGALEIYDSSEDDLRRVVIRESLFSGNLVDDDEGGAIYYDGGSSALADGLLIENSTFSENRAYSGAGGGLYLDDTDAPVRIVSSTIVNNAIDDANDGGGIYNKVDGVELTNTIVADNYAEGSDEDNLGTDGNTPGQGSFDIGFSLIGDDVSPAGTGILTTATTPGSNIFEKDPRLGPLSNNGGPTLTQLPSLQSPAVDAGSAAMLTTDQRGFTRPVNRPDVPNAGPSDGADIGAVEVGLDPDVAVTGATINAPGKQKVKKKLKTLQVSAGAGENVTAVASGVVKSGDLAFDLKSKSSAIGPGGKVTFKLKLKKKKAAKKITNLLKKGKKATASFQVDYTDTAGNEKSLSDKTKLTGKKKKKKK